MIKHIFTLIWNKRRKNFLLFLEIFLAFAVLFAVFTFAIQNLRVYQSPLGFDTENIWVAYTSYDEKLDSAALYDLQMRIEQELEEKPEIESVAFMGSVTPFSGSMWRTSNDDNGFELGTYMILADRDYWQTSGINLTKGRWFQEGDRNAKYTPVVITEQLREEEFGGKEVLDSVYVISGENKIVGYVDHYKYLGEFEKEVGLTFFYKERGSRELSNIVMKVKPGTTAAFEEEVNQTIADLIKRNDFIIQNLDSERINNSRPRWIPLVASLSICGFLIINVALGLFGVLWYTISKRKAEIGLRRTVGATKNRITEQFVGEVFMVAGLAIFLGLFFAIQLPLMNVFDVADSNYYWSMIFTSLLIISVVLLCAFYPSRQAANIHPALALHEE